MEIIKYSDIEILKDTDNYNFSRYYVVSNWYIEVYNGVAHEVPTILKEMSEQEFLMLEKRYYRERKLVRLFNDDITTLIKNNLK